MPKWTDCKTAKCDEHRSTCRTCAHVDDFGCFSHTIKQIKIGEYAYCNDYKCLDEAFCTKCKIGKIPSRECQGVDQSMPCKATNTECIACTAFKPDLTWDYLFYCPECYSKYQENTRCRACRAFTADRFKCSCCKLELCSQCDKNMTVNTSPITLFGYGLSVNHSDYYCRKCSSGQTVKSIQQVYRKTGEFICRAHSTTL